MKGISAEIQARATSDGQVMIHLQEQEGARDQLAVMLDPLAAARLAHRIVEACENAQDILAGNRGRN